jgi:peptidoglycan/LPS O-acetylase OafA/YrhL
MSKFLSYIPHLDGLRAFAFLLVYLYHTEPSLIPFGWVGIDLFFVLSGFLITRILRKSLESGNNLKNYLTVFFTRRTLRIFPLYYLVLFLVLFLLPLFGQYFNTATDHNELSQYAVYFITYTQNFLIGFRGEYLEVGYLNHFWTLAIEEHFYLIWPFIIFFIKSKKNILRCTIFLIISISVFRIFSVLYGADQLLIKMSTFYRLDTLLIGSFLGILTEDMRLRWLDKTSSKKIVSLFSLLVIVIFLIGSLGHYQFSQTFTYSLLAIFSAMMLLIIYYRSSSLNFLANKHLVYLGKLSYGCYVYHYPIILLLKNRLDVLFSKFFPNLFFTHLFRDIVLLILTIVISHFSFKLFEKRFLKLKKKFKYT